MYCFISLRFFQSSDANLCIMIKIIYRPCLFLTKTSQDLICFHTCVTGYYVSQHASINHISRIYTHLHLKYGTEKRFPPLSRHKTNIRAVTAVFCNRQKNEISVEITKRTYKILRSIIKDNRKSQSKMS